MDGIDTSAGNKTLNFYFDESLKYRGLRDTTAANYRRMWDLHVRQGIGRKKAADIKNANIQAVYADLKEKGLKRNSIKMIHALLSGTFKFLVKNDVVRKNPCEDALSFIEEDAEEKTPFTEKQANSLIDFCKKSKVYNSHVPYLVIAFNLGLRVGEITGLTWSDIDFQNDTVCVNKQLVYKKLDGSGWGFHIRPPKTEDSKRTIDISNLQAVKNAFLEERRNQMMLGIVCNATIDEVSNFVFLSRNGQPLAPNAVNNFLKNIENAYNKANPKTPVPHLASHICRHSCLTIGSIKGMTPKELQALAGHSSARITSDIYDHTSTQRTAEGFRRIGGDLVG